MAGGLGLPVDGHTDSMLACYPGDGAFYTPHVDGDAADTRRLTLVLYLNRAWKPSDGGCLQIMDPDLFEWQVVPPRSGTMAVFRSGDILHQVAPSHVPRYALSLWIVCDGLRRAEWELCG